MNPRTGLTGQSYGNTGTPITMDMGGFYIYYREPICGGNRQSFHKTSTMLQAVAEFNTLETTSGFDTPLRIERWTVVMMSHVPRMVTLVSRIVAVLVATNVGVANMITDFQIELMLATGLIVWGYIVFVKLS